MEMVQHDLLQRKVNVRRMGDIQKRSTLELVLREEEEYQHLIMYRRDQRFRNPNDDFNHKLQLDRTILDMLHCPMRMHEKILNLLYNVGCWMLDVKNVKMYSNGCVENKE